MHYAVYYELYITLMYYWHDKVGSHGSYEADESDPFFTLCRLTLVTAAECACR